MYKVSADINDVKPISVDLTPGFQLDVYKILQKMEGSKIMFLCSPVNPTGNLLSREDKFILAEKYHGILVVDEAYIDFCPEGSSLVPGLEKYPNLVILQTLSKAWGLAGIRMGIALAHERIIQILNRIKPPYNVNILTQKAALEALNNEKEMRKHFDQILEEREILANRLSSFSYVENIFPS